ncbi:hypothetical protein HY085_03120, partial [Candidatus Gottesmanbacteria bacterium]|nr:hypothetical protein [Candidatus Gottesmanbacteria bacterium]
MDIIILQVPVDKKLKLAAQKEAKKLGFSTLQDAVRLFLAKLAAGELIINFAQKPLKTASRE